MSSARRNPEGQEPDADLREMFRLLGEAMPRAGVPGGGGAAPGAAIPADSADTVVLLAQLYFRCVAGTFRYWGRVAETWARLAPALASALADPAGASPDGGAARAILLDELRAALRELADLPAQQWRNLEADLARLGGPGAAAGDRGKAGPYWRRWDVKP